MIDDLGIDNNLFIETPEYQGICCICGKCENLSCCSPKANSRTVSVISKDIPYRRRLYHSNFSIDGMHCRVCAECILDGEADKLIVQSFTEKLE